MKTEDTIKGAIGRSISHNEIVRVEVDDKRAALEALENDENITNLDYATENDGDLDVWGERLGGEFRIRVSVSAL